MRRIGIHALDGEQDMSRMGGLWRRMPMTYATMLDRDARDQRGARRFSGFFSKDLILERTFDAGNVGLWLIGIITAGLTAFYMFRLLFLTFHGTSRVAPDKHVHESPPVMTMPLIVLAVLAVVGGCVELPDGWLWGGAFTHFLEPVFGPFRARMRRMARLARSGLVAMLATFIGIRARVRALHPEARAARTDRRGSVSALYQMLVRKYYVDELYNLVFARFLFWGSENVLNRGVDHGLIDGIVNGTGLGGRGIRRARRGARRPATFSIYAFVYLLGAVGIAAYYVYLVMGADGRLLADRVDLHAAARRAGRAGAARGARDLARRLHLLAHPARHLHLPVRGLRPGPSRATSSSSNTRGFRSSGSRITSGWTASACSWCC